VNETLNLEAILRNIAGNVPKLIPITGGNKQNRKFSFERKSRVIVGKEIGKFSKAIRRDRIDIVEDDMLRHAGYLSSKVHRDRCIDL